VRLVRSPLGLPACALVAAVAVAASGCGGAGEGAPAATSPAAAGEPAPPAGPAPEGSVLALLEDDPREDIALVFGSSDFAVGENRVSFLVVDSESRVVEAERASVRVARGGLDAVPTLAGTAENLPVGASPSAGAEEEFDLQRVWVTELALDAPGRYTLLVEPEGANVQAVGTIEVRERSAAPAVGEEAIPSDTPTLADGFPDEITTATPPDVELLRHSVAESLEDGVPFVVTFATPKYCQSRVCGPVVEVVDRVRQELAGSPVRFIHVEIYEGNDPANGFNRWVEEWGLPTEPYTFLVDAAGVIRARFEGLVTASELEQAVREHLL
jgi:hypothetical protein